MKHYSIAVVLLVLTFAGCKDQPDNGKLTVRKQTEVTADETKEVFVNDVGVASFPTPTGWRPNRSNGNTAIILTRENADGQPPNEMFSIDIGKPLTNSVEESAKGIAEKFNGTVTAFADGLDGETAFRVSVPPNYDTLMPRECIVAHHDDKVCFIFAGSKSKTDIWPAMLELTRSWKWN